MNFKKLKPEDKLSFLSQEELESLFFDYYEDKLKVRVIIDKYNLPIKSSIESYLPHEYTDEFCCYCNNKMLSKPGHRDYGEPEIYCDNCGHVDSNYCNCFNCEVLHNEKMKKAYEKKENVLKSHFELNKKLMVPFNKLTFSEKITLGAFVKYLASEKLTFLFHIKRFSSNKNEIKHFKDLVKRNILVLHPQNEIDEFGVSLNKFGENLITYNEESVAWLLNVDKDKLEHPELLKYFASSNSLLEMDNIEGHSFFKKIIIEESFEYLKYYSSIVLGLDIKKTIQVDEALELLSGNFSISQIYNIIYGRVSYTGTYCKEHNLTSSHVLNLLLKNLKSFNSKAIENGWEVKHFNKPNYLRESIFTSFFFDKVLRVGEQGFRMSITEFDKQMGNCQDS